MKNLILLFLSALILSCTNREKSTSTEASHEESQHEHDALALNDGEKWTVNDEMKPYVANGSTLVKEYLESKNTDYKTLATKLQEQNKALIKSCTMKGKSHDQLHKWLHPHLELTGALEDAEPSEAREIVEQLRDSYELYGEYFQ